MIQFACLPHGKSLINSESMSTGPTLQASRIFKFGISARQRYNCTIPRITATFYLRRLLLEQREARFRRDREQEERRQQAALERNCREAVEAERRAREDERKRSVVAKYR